MRWIHEFDDKGWIEFAPLQGELAEKFGLGGYAEKGGGSLVVLREPDGEIFTKSDAVAELGKALGGVFRVLAFMLSRIPGKLRDGIYDWVARNRYRLLGKADACALPDKGLRERMRE